MRWRDELRTIEAGTATEAILAELEAPDGDEADAEGVHAVHAGQVPRQGKDG